MGKQRKSSRGSRPQVATGGFRARSAAGPRGACGHAQPPVVLLSGLTGAGKSAALAALRRLGEQVLDLQSLAAHRGSAFGGFGRPAQPTHRQFQAAARAELGRADPDRVLWIEGCPHYLGSVGMPAELLEIMATAPHIELRRIHADRVAALVAEYGSAPARSWLAAIDRISARLGPTARDARDAVLAGHLDEAVDVLLHYYDRGYTYASRRAVAPPVAVIGPEVTGDDERAYTLRALLATTALG